MKISWIGTGVMGGPMALHCQRKGYPIKAYNRTFAKAQALEPRITACETIKSCVSDADIVFSIVGYPKDVEEVYQEVMNYVSPGTILVDMTTSSPTLAKKLAKQARDKGLIMLDAPVTGGDVGAINATLSIMVGGDQQAFETIKPILECMGTTITYMGEDGNGQYSKLANQVVIAGNIAGIAEGLAFAIKQNLPTDKFMDVITGGSASSWQAQINGHKMLESDFRPGFYIKHFLKDLRLVIAEEKDLNLPVIHQVIKVYEKLVEDGLENEGTQAIIKYYQSSMK